MLSLPSQKKDYGYVYNDVLASQYSHIPPSDSVISVKRRLISYGYEKFLDEE
jgi:hypothetical protein